MVATLCFQPAESSYVYHAASTYHALTFAIQSWQHRVRAQHVTSEGLILHLFDNANANYVSPNQTLGLDFHLNLTSKEATVLKKLADPDEPLYATSQGAYGALPNGNVFMGYGELPVFKEFGPAGE
jgi:hypothetical protein